MKVLYAIQGTGNGHLSRARDVIPALLKQNVTLDILVSGIQADIQLPYPVKYQLKGLSFSHQAAVLSPKAPKPKKKDPLGKWILNNYAPTSHQFGLHFKSYESGIFTPIIRNDIRLAALSTLEHYTVYLPSYSDEKLLKFLSNINGVRWEVFSKHNKKEYINNNIHIQPITNEAFVKSMATSKGILCGAGFETPAESLFMKKKLLVIPMKGQYEQQCNAAALAEMGVPIIKSLKNKHLNTLQKWLDTDTIITVDYPDNTDNIVSQLLKESQKKH